VIAFVVIVLTLLLARGPSAALPRGTDVLAGFVSGVLSTSTSTSGPPLVLALQAKGPSPDEFRGTIAASFLAQGWITLVAFWLAGRLDAEIGRLALIGLPGLVVGFVGGELLSRRVRPERFRSVVLALLIVTGASLLIRSLVA